MLFKICQIQLFVGTLREVFEDFFHTLAQFLLTASERELDYHQNIQINELLLHFPDDLNLRIQGNFKENLEIFETLKYLENI